VRLLLGELGQLIESGLKGSAAGDQVPLGTTDDEFAIGNADPRSGGQRVEKVPTCEGVAPVVRLFLWRPRHPRIIAKDQKFAVPGRNTERRQIRSTSEQLMSTPSPRPEFLTVDAAAALLSLDERTIQGWIDAGTVPYLKLPNGSYRIPQGLLLGALRDNYDLGVELRDLDERNVAFTDEQVQARLSHG
jgi:excisionase family DNA binding protein